MTAGWLRGVIRSATGAAVPQTVVKFGGSLLMRRTWRDELRSVSYTHLTLPTILRV